MSLRPIVMCPARLCSSVSRSTSSLTPYFAGGSLGYGCGADQGGHGGMDRQVADRFRLVPARCDNAGAAAPVLRAAVPAGGGGLGLLRAAGRADCYGLGG